MMGAFQLTDFKATSLATRQQCRQRYTTAQAFAERNDVGAYTVLLFGEQGAAMADAGLHFVEDQQNAQLAAQPLDTLEVMLGRPG